jgi:hypothetical protein
VTAEDFRKEFGFRGVEFGNWAASDERQQHVNKAYDALRDLSNVLGIPPDAVSLNGTLGLAFGARGQGGAAAHYESSKLVINITKLRGPGSVAHEWGHALDHYFGELNRPDAYKGKARGASGWYDLGRYTGEPQQRFSKTGVTTEMRLPNIRPEMARAFDRLMSALFQRDRTKAEAVREAELRVENLQHKIKEQTARLDAAKAKESPDKKFIKDMTEYIADLKMRADAAGRRLTELTGDKPPATGYGKVETSFYKEAQKLSGKSGDYWKRPTEMFARSFESYIFDRLGKQSDYLVHGVEGDRYASDKYKGNPYPAGPEREAINAAYNHLFDTMEHKPGDKGTMLFSRDKPAGSRPAPRETEPVEEPPKRPTSGFKSKGFSSDRDLEDLTREDKAPESPAREQNLARFMEGSKVVNEDGSPKVVYHGTNLTFDKFEKHWIGATTDGGHYGRGFYFSTDPDTASLYAKKRGDSGSQVMPVHLSIKDPFVVDFSSHEAASQTRMRAKEAGAELNAWGAAKSADQFTEAVKQAGYDGVKIVGKYEGEPDEWVAFEPEQIKSATGNRGTFDKRDPNIFASPVQQARPTPSTPRIPVAPIRGKEAKPINEIMMDVTRGVGQRVATAKMPKGAGGYYDPRSSFTTIKFAGNLDTTAHELAHALDDKFGIVADWAHQPTSPFDAELQPFAEHGSIETTGPRSTPLYVRAEGVAEWLRAWMVNPQAAEAAAPQFAQHALGKLPKETLKALKQFSDDIRSFAGSTAHSKIMANVQWEAPETGMTDWMTGGKAKNGPGFRLTWADTAKAELLDRLHPFMKAMRYVRNERGLDSKPLPKDDPELLARLYMGMHAKMDSIFEKGMIDSQGNRVTQGGIEWLMEPLDKKNLDTELKEVASFMIAQRTLEKAKQLGKGRVSGIGAGLESDVDVAMQRLADLHATDPAKLKRIEEAADRYRQWADANLKYLLDKGRISVEQYDGIKQNNEYYVAMQRILEVAPGEELVTLIPKSAGGSKLGSAKQPIQAFEGSTRTIKNPYSSLMDATYRAVREADRNEVMKLFRDLLVSDRQMYQGQQEDLASVGRRAQEGEKETIPVYVNGEKEIWQFHPDVYKALKAVDDTAMQLPKFLEVLTWPGRIMRVGITKMPPFALRNLIRDAFQRTVVSTNGSKPWDSLKRFTEKEKDTLSLAGGDQAGHYYRDDRDYQKAMKQAMKELMNQRNVIVAAPGKLGSAYSDIIEAGERQGRLAEYRRAFAKAKKDGLDDYNASLRAAGEARELLDFSIAGNTMRVINRFVPFTNAAIQGLRIAGKRFMENPVAVGARWFAWVATPTLLNYFWNQAHGDIDEYRELPAYQRDLFWNTKIGPDLWLALPKPFEMGAAATSIERMLDSAMGNERAFEGHWRSLANSFLPVDEQALFGPLQSAGAAIANYDFFRDRPIVPRHEENLELNLRRTDRASRLGQVLQRAVGVDARKLDFLVESQLGYMGKWATATSDIGRKDRQGFSASSTGVLRSDPVESALDVKWIHDKAVERGALGTKEWKRFQEVKNEYHKAEGADAREAQGRKVRAAARKLRREWERHPPRPDAEKKLRRKRLLEGAPDPVLDAMGMAE